MEINKQVVEYLNSIYQNASTGMQSINDLIDSVKNDKLKQELNEQLQGYQLIHSECEKFAIKHDINLKDNTWLEKAKMWTSIKMSTVMDNSTRHLAEMLLLGTVMGLNACYKDRWDYQNINEELDELLSKLEVMEEEYYKNFKHFLKGDVEKQDKEKKECYCEHCDCNK